jgi:RNA polymerase sigma factor (sigma-70 family)
VTGLGAAARGVDAGFAAAYAEHYDVLVRLAYVTTGSLVAAEDVVQDAFVALLRDWDSVEQPGAWLRRVVANRSVSWLRRLVVARRHALTAGHLGRDGAVTPPSPEDAAVRQALARLAPRHRAAVFLRYYLDLPESAIAATLGCRPGTVRSLLHRALRVLKEHLDDA